MLLILESEDQTGKTSIGRKLSEELNIPYIKLNNINIDDNQSIRDNVSISTHSQLETFVQLYEKGVIKDAILDRFHISEFVYNTLFDRTYSISYIGELEARLAKFDDVYLIRCRTSDAEHLERWKENEKLLSLNQRENLRYLYDVWYNKTILPIVEVNTDNDIGFSSQQLIGQLYKMGIYQNHPKPSRWAHEMTMMEIAKTISKRGTCLNRQVGAVLTEDGFIVGVGYNGPPSGLDHCKTCIRRERNIPSGQGMELSRALHAEENAIQQSGIRNRSDKDLRIFCTDSPCISCMRKLIQIGINKVYYLRKYNDELAWQMAEEAGVEMIPMEG